MELTRREFDARKERDPPVILKDFLANSEDKLRKLRTDLKTAKEAYTSVVEYFGENPRILAPSTFFSLFVRFSNAYKVGIVMATGASLILIHISLALSRGRFPS